MHYDEYMILKQGSLHVAHKCTLYARDKKRHFKTLTVYDIDTRCGIGCLADPKYNILTPLRSSNQVFVNPSDIYLTTKLPEEKFYDELCPKCFPNGIEQE